MGLPSLPKFVWWVIGVLIVLVVLVLLKVDINIGGHGFSISQNLVH
jgi:hypothetical protein